MSFSPFLSVEQACDQVLQWTSEQLTQAGLRTVQTFNLHTARAGGHNCPCPNHGTSECDCQLVILLVYGESLEPISLILHGNNGQTWLSLAEIPSTGLAKSVQRVLETQSANTKTSN